MDIIVIIIRGNSIDIMDRDRIVWGEPVMLYINTLLFVCGEVPFRVNLRQLDLGRW